jgi:hypothetical protein
MLNRSEFFGLVIQGSIKTYCNLIQFINAENTKPRTAESSNFNVVSLYTNQAVSNTPRNTVDFKQQKTFLASIPDRPYQPLIK